MEIGDFDLWFKKSQLPESNRFVSGCWKQLAFASASAIAIAIAIAVLAHSSSQGEKSCFILLIVIISEPCLICAI
jgi:hypothetical protein